MKPCPICGSAIDESHIRGSNVVTYIYCPRCGLTQELREGLGEYQLRSMIYNSLACQWNGEPERLFGKVVLKPCSCGTEVDMHNVDLDVHCATITCPNCIRSVKLGDETFTAFYRRAMEAKWDHRIEKNLTLAKL